ncbi:unnamed protein product, partial [Prorocentrum cordatum]
AVVVASPGPAAPVVVSGTPILTQAQAHAAAEIQADVDGGHGGPVPEDAGDDVASDVWKAKKAARSARAKAAAERRAEAAEEERRAMRARGIACRRAMRAAAERRAEAAEEERRAMRARNIACPGQPTIVVAMAAGGRRQ